MAKKKKGYKAGGRVSGNKSVNKRPRSEMLEDKIYERQAEKFKASQKKNRDRGSSGRATEVEETLKIVDEFRKDKNLLDTYGKDAPKSRAFMTEREGMKAGGKVKGMKMGGKVKGMKAGGRVKGNNAGGVMSQGMKPVRIF